MSADAFRVSSKQKRVLNDDMKRIQGRQTGFTWGGSLKGRIDSDPYPTRLIKGLMRMGRERGKQSVEYYGEETSKVLHKQGAFTNILRTSIANNHPSPLIIDPKRGNRKSILVVITSQCAGPPIQKSAPDGNTNLCEDASPRNGEDLEMLERQVSKVEHLFSTCTQKVKYRISTQETLEKDQENIFKITVLRFLSKSISFILSEWNIKTICYHVFQHGIIARELPTQKVPHLTKPTSKTTCTKRNGPKAIQEQVLVKVSRINLTRVPNPFATREPGQPCVRRRGMTTTSYTDPDASLSLLRRIGDTSITRVVKDL
ncbi:hypothetical protein LXL04_000260 [Taraxacum kok-saghyz]